MDEQEWVIRELDQLFDSSQDYKQKALLKAAADLIREQETRKQQLQGELDGTLWSPGNWGN
ncbi:hypothetical protein [Alkalibacterium pelagium]|jgi:hypothetical protein|uniref:Uncharacterized protein n=1 Tax=Alkalibacterium pelagium TaxID=426702 RepID=A0A1H7LL42_9LACT|nr:hypothetical protein [Alkalibacterium pelagium]GEN50848.1 hypothetical protein APE02nite_15130 [Alkalibacterium pelagium]SEK99670.1 hypothetical protein SAMN04488099_109115 [Alkalibacterium pelagium]